MIGEEPEQVLQGGCGQRPQHQGQHQGNEDRPQRVEEALPDQHDLQLPPGHADGLEHGELFSACVARFPALYDRKLTALIRVGEETNRLPEMLRRQGEALTEELEFRIKRMGSLLEPALIMLVGLLVAVILISMYMPMFRLGGIMG